MPPVIIGAAIAGAAGIGGALINSSATNNATNEAASAAQANNALQSQIYGENSANAQPYIQSGDTAETALNGFLGLGGDPAASQTAFNNYLSSTGYQFNLDQGLNAVSQSKAAGGMLDSGATLKALDSYGTGLANSYGQQYEQNLAGVANTGENAVNALTGAGQSYANAVSSNNNSAATVSANAALAGAANTNALLGTLVKGVGSGSGLSSFTGGGGSSGANAFSGSWNVGG